MNACEPLKIINDSPDRLIIMQTTKLETLMCGGLPTCHFTAETAPRKRISTPNDLPQVQILSLLAAGVPFNSIRADLV